MFNAEEDLAALGQAMFNFYLFFKFEKKQK